MYDNTLHLLKKAKDGDKGARDDIVEQNLPLVWSVVKKFTGRGYEAEDLFQIGCIGIIKAVEKFDLSYNVRFSTYAVPMIMGEIRRFLRDDGIIKVSRSLKEIAVKASYAKDSLEKKNGREATISEIATEIGVSIDDLVMATDAVCAPQSLYKSIHEGEKNDIFLIDKISSNDGDEDKLIDKIALRNVIGTLCERDRKIILLRYFKGKTQCEISKMLGISQVQVSRLEKKILGLLHAKLA